MKRNRTTTLLFTGLAFLLMGWGYNGHQKINGNASLSFTSEMEKFHDWVSALVSHASDADERKQWDPNEGPRHYIDIDLYGSFLENGTIPQDIDEAIAIYGNDFVYDAGVLPWATLNTYDSLVSCMERFDWEKAILFASDLGHYVGDGHMPLHITKNYNGQFSNNYGIHSRYESSMINTYNSQLVYEGGDVEYIQNVNQYVFDYLYFNYTYVDSVLLADDYAKTVNSNTSSNEYKAALWDRTKGFTTMLFRNASNRLAELIYSAWVDAGQPHLFTGPFIFTPEKEHTDYLEQNIPNPFYGSTLITYSLPDRTDLTLEVRDSKGLLVTTLAAGEQSQGEHQVEWQSEKLAEGMYFLVLRTRQSVEIRKMLVIR